MWLLVNMTSCTFRPLVDATADLHVVSILFSRTRSFSIARHETSCNGKICSHIYLSKKERERERERERENIIIIGK